MQKTTTKVQYRYLPFRIGNKNSWVLAVRNTLTSQRMTITTLLSMIVLAIILPGCNSSISGNRERSVLSPDSSGVTYYQVITADGNSNPFIIVDSIPRYYSIGDTVYVSPMMWPNQGYLIPNDPWRWDITVYDIPDKSGNDSLVISDVTRIQVVIKKKQLERKSS